MKKIHYVLLLVLVTLISCKKTKHETELPVNESAISQVLTSKNLQEQKSMYNLLTFNEKAGVWQRKFENLLSKESFNLEQKKFIKKLIQLVTPDLLKQLSESQKSSHIPKENEIKVEAIKLFGVGDAFYLLATISNSKFEPEYVPNAINPAPSCECSKSSDFCDGDLKCQSSACNNTTSGCGFVWGYACNGMCRYGGIIYN